MKSKAFKLTAIALTSMASQNAAAVEGGTFVNWQEHPYLIESNCTGTVLAGKFILLAGHCGASVTSPFPNLVDFANGDSMMPTTRNAEPYYDKDGIYNGGVDVAMWTLPESAKMDKVVFISDLNDNTTAVKLNDKVSFMGFGQDDHTARLGQAFNEVVKTYGEVFIYGDPIQHSVPGDSGAPVFNAKNKIIGVHYSSNGGSDPQTGLYEQNGTNLRYVKNWVLKTINDWHSVTELKFTGTKTIDVQSLHVDNVNMIDSWNAGTLTSGGVTVTGGTCVTKADVKPFEICTLELEATTEHGFVNFDTDNKLTINRPVPTPTPPQPKPTPKPADSGKSGGSMGIFSLLALFGMSFRRKFNR